MEKQNQVAHSCKDCGKRMLAGESIYYNKHNEPCCLKCAAKTMNAE